MARNFDKPILIQRINEVTEEWYELFTLHAYINKAKSGDQYLNAGSTRTQKALTFEVRYFEALEDISFNLQGYRIVYQGVPFSIEDYDDYELTHKTVKLSGVSY